MTVFDRDVDSTSNSLPEWAQFTTIVLKNQSI